MNLQVRVFAFLLVFLATPVTAQKCESGPDPYTKVERSTFVDERMGISFVNINDSIILELDLSFKGGLNQSIVAGSTIFIKLEGDHIIEMASIQDSHPTIKGEGLLIRSEYHFKLRLTSEQLHQLSQHNVILVRHPDPNGQYFKSNDYYNKKWHKTITEGAICVVR